MERIHISQIHLLKLIVGLLFAFSVVACTDEEDNYKRRHDFNLELETSSKSIYLDETTPNDVALTLEWTPAVDKGLNYNITYLYEVDFNGKTETPIAPIKQYVDDNNFKISYTHQQLQELLLEYWQQKTGRTVALQFRVTASYEGSTMVVPEMASSVVTIHLYGDKQFEAEKIFMHGTAVGTTDVEMKGNTQFTSFAYTGQLSEGTINFPISFQLDDKVNVLAPAQAEEEVVVEPMSAKILSAAEANSWLITEPNLYRITVDLVKETVSIVPLGEVIEADVIYLAGSAIGTEIELKRTLENANVFAFKGELKAGTLYLPIEYEGDKQYALVPKNPEEQDLDDGSSMKVEQVTTTATASRHWKIPSDDTYRVVMNIETKELTIYSSATDMKPKEVSWNNTVIGQNPFVSKVEKLWMYGAGTSYKFNDELVLTPSLASPYIFVYSGKALGSGINFKVSNIQNNVYAYGAFIAGNSNRDEKYVEVTNTDPHQLDEGQSNNRYAFFNIPINTNFVVVDIENLTVIFDEKATE